ncbi:MAG: rhodanese-like domain-containing protein [Bacteroidia bacterium]|jgi:rhodanese-related sulfurtransferase|nr:rhodanese-like domain-containing protein [Bacteroidia bacterium]
MVRAIIFLGSVLSLFTSCQAQVGSGSYNAMLKTLLKHSVPEITVDSLEKCANNVLLLDAREIAEYNVSHIANARHVGYDKFNIASLTDIPKDKRIVVYCSVGYRSEKITEKLRAAGYTNVSNLYGGIFEWVNQGNKVVDNAGKTTEKVHAYSKSWGVWLTRGQKVYK